MLLRTRRALLAGVVGLLSTVTVAHPARAATSAAMPLARPSAQSVQQASPSDSGRASGQTSGRAVPLGAGEARYIVRTSGTAALDRVQARLATLGVRPLDRWEHALTGLLVQATPQRAAALARVPGVVSVERTVPMTTQDLQYSPPNWGLDRIDQRTALDPSFKAFGYPSTGAGVTAYVIDTGVRLTHEQFAGRLNPAVSYYYPFPQVERNGTVYCAPTTNADDRNYHGTHVAGVLAGATVGVARGATVVPVKVLDCEGNGDDGTVIAGINWVVAHHAAGVPAVANLSLGGPASSALDAAVVSLRADGITVVVAAGNQSDDTCGRSPARVASLITVSASETNDRAAPYANFGPCNDIFAPGTEIRSAWYGSDTGLVGKSGTSMASPFVAGAAALLLGRSPSLTPAQVWSALDASSTKGVVAEKAGDPDKLLYVEQFVAVPPWRDGLHAFDAPLRMLDTRPGGRGVWEPVDQSTRFAAREVRRYSTASRLPANASLVVNIVAVDPRASGFLTVYPCASSTSPRPVVSFLNYRTRVNSANAGVIGVGSSGGLCVYALTDVHVVIDAVGWLPQGVTYASLSAPVRLFDTRASTNGTNNRGVLEASVDEAVRFEPGEVRRYSPLGAGGGKVPATGVSALAVNVAAVLPSAAGEVRVYPCDATTDVPPITSTTTFPAGATVTVGAVVTMSATASFCVQATVATDVIVDATGRFDAAGGFAVPASPGQPLRMLDTRAELTGVTEQVDVSLPLAGATSGATLLSFAGVAGVPTSPTLRALVLTVTVRDPAAAGFVKVWACSSTSSMAPTTSVVNYSPGMDTANLVVVPVSATTGELCIRVSTTAHVTIDVASWMVEPS